MNILATSDLHGQLLRLPSYIQATDIGMLICAGDMEPTDVGNMEIMSDYFEAPGFRRINKEREAEGQKAWVDNQFIPWAEKVKPKHIIYVNGNHTFGDSSEWLEYGCGFTPRTITLDGVKIGLLPGSMPFTGEWSDEQDEIEMDGRIYELDRDIEILVSHVPPYGILDKTYGGDRIGCRALSKAIFGSSFSEEPPYFTNLKHLFFGHCHEASGDRTEVILGREINFHNCSQRLVEVEM